MMNQTHEEQTSRRLRTLQKIGLFTDNPPTVNYRRALTYHDLTQAYKLVHDTYVNSGYIQSQSSGMRIREYECSSHCATFIATNSNQVVGVMSIINDSIRWGLPSESVFAEEIARLRKAAPFLGELSNQAIAESFCRSPVATELMRFVYAFTLHQETTDVVCAVSEYAVPFYEFLGFQPMSGPKEYCRETGDNAVLMGLHCVQTRWTSDPIRDPTIDSFWRNFFVATNPFIEPVEAWGAADTTVLRRLEIHKTSNRQIRKKPTTRKGNK